MNSRRNIVPSRLRQRLVALVAHTAIIGARSGSVDGGRLGVIRRNRPVSFDDLVSAGEKRLWHDEAECLCGLEVNDQLEFTRSIHS